MSESEKEFVERIKAHVYNMPLSLAERDHALALLFSGAAKETVLTAEQEARESFYLKAGARAHYEARCNFYRIGTGDALTWEELSDTSRNNEIAWFHAANEAGLKRVCIEIAKTALRWQAQQTGPQFAGGA